MNKDLKKISVYIASPYTLGDVAKNVHKQMQVADALIEHGFFPFVPLYSHFQHMCFPREYVEWIRLDNFWVEKCDCILRLTGESKGADEEVRLAEKNGIPVFHTVNEVVKYYWNNSV